MPFLVCFGGYCLFVLVGMASDNMLCFESRSFCTGGVIPSRSFRTGRDCSPVRDNLQGTVFNFFNSHVTRRDVTGRDVTERD